MYRLMIVDDEEEIREGLSDLVDWSSLGFMVIEKLQDGQDAIRYLKDHQVDVILTDIKMTYVSGIDLAQYVYNQKLNTKVVILSGFQEFDLARAAIRYNVSHYLLKPTDLEEVALVFNKIGEELAQEKWEREQQYQQNQHVKTLRPLLMEQFFSNLLQNRSKIRNTEELHSKLKQTGLLVDSVNSRCCLLQAEWSDMSSGPVKIKSDIYQSITLAITKEREQISYICVHSAERQFFIIGIALCEMTNEQFQKKAEQYFLQIQNSLSALLSLSARLEQFELCATMLVLIETCKRISELSEAEEDAEEEGVKTYTDERMIIRQAKQFIDEHFETDHSLGEVANHVGLNPVYFSRLFKQETGQTYSDYCTDIRMRKAMDYLKDPKYKIYEIGFLVGYRNTKYFHKLFKRQTGLTPSEYRNQL